MKSRHGISMVKSESAPTCVYFYTVIVVSKVIIYYNNMKWYSGDIAGAVMYSKSRGAIFVVYIEGTNEQSQKITTLIENGALGQKLEQEHFVAIKLTAGSVSHQQFSEIYKEPSVPSIYFIGKTGTPLDIVTGNDNLEILTERVDKLLSKAGIAVRSTASGFSHDLINSERSEGRGQAVTENDQINSNTSVSVSEHKYTSVPRDEKQASSSNEEKENIPENPRASVEENEPSPLTSEEKKERAIELLEIKRQQKEREEKENERLKEIERRKMGQSVQQLKKWQEDQEMKQLKEERDREKRENQQARERVLAQIAQDKAERLSKSQAHSPATNELPKPASPPVSSIKSNTTRLQFKLPDGSSSMKEFAVSDSLQTVISYIKANLKLPFSDFTLSTTFPRREFSTNDYSQSLMDLQLVPNAVILVLPKGHGLVSTNPGGTISALIWTLLAPLWNIFGYLKIFVFGSNPNAGSNKRPSEGSPEQRPEQQKKKMRDSPGVRRQGNIHRLGDNDSDDERKTWNGNSTQQM